MLMRGGKTRALTHRIAKLIHDGVPPWQILAVTFTNKAATEMKDRIKNILHMTEGDEMSMWDLNAGKLPVMGTFHSICARILRKDIDKLSFPFIAPLSTNDYNIHMNNFPSILKICFTVIHVY